jgi:hypothetical protein
MIARRESAAGLSTSRTGNSGSFSPRYLSASGSPHTVRDEASLHLSPLRKRLEHDKPGFTLDLADRPLSKRSCARCCLSRPRLVQYEPYLHCYSGIAVSSSCGGQGCNNAQGASPRQRSTCQHDDILELEEWLLIPMMYPKALRRKEPTVSPKRGVALCSAPWANTVYPLCYPRLQLPHTQLTNCNSC